MGKIISNALIILMMVLFPPAALITVSQGAADGDLAYPIKRGLEDSILFLTSFNPTTRAYFAVARANRRYEETALLLSKGNNASSTLEELVTQSNTAAGDIGKISSASRRALLIADLSNSITRYDQGLAQANEKISQDTHIRNSGSAPSPQPEASASPFKPKPSLPGSGISPAPSYATQPTPQPSATAATFAPKPTGSADEDTRRQQEAIEKARRELEELRKRLEAEKKKLQSESLQQSNFKQNDGSANSPVPSPKPSPSPSLSPLPSPLPSPSPKPSITPVPSVKKFKNTGNPQSNSQEGEKHNSNSGGSKNSDDE